MSELSQACETPLTDLLRYVPKDLRVVKSLVNGGSHSIPVGEACHAAAERIRQLERVRDNLLQGMTRLQEAFKE